MQIFWNAIIHDSTPKFKGKVIALSNLVADWRAGRTRIDDSLDVFACHGICGIWGSIATGLFATTMINNVNGLFYGNVGQLGAQVVAV